MAKSDKPYKATDKTKQSVETPETDEIKALGKETEEALSVDTTASNPEIPASETPEITLDDKIADANLTAEPLDDVVKDDKEDGALPASDETVEAKNTGPAEADVKEDAPASVLQESDVASLPDDTADEKDKRDSDKAPWGAKSSDIAEAETDPVPDLTSEPIIPPPPPPPQTKIIKASPWPALFGGVVAAAIGFVIGRGDLIDQYLPASLQRPSVDLSAIEAQAADMEAENDAQAARLDALEAVSIASVIDSVAALEADLEAVASRLAEVETRPATAPVATGAPVEAVEELQSALADQNAQIAALAERARAAEAEAAGEAARLLARAALIRVQTAVDSGQTFDTALADLEAVSPAEIPTALREAAETGVPTLAGLQSSFPESARAGLAAARAEVPESDVVGITGFIQRQLNVRSITPREGDDPDAILSRVQAAVSAGDLTTALTEAEALPAAARDAMNDWLEAATARKTAQDAADTLADSLDSN